MKLEEHKILWFEWCYTTIFATRPSVVQWSLTTNTIMPCVEKSDKMECIQLDRTSYNVTTFQLVCYVSRAQWTGITVQRGGAKSCMLMNTYMLINTKHLLFVSLKCQLWLLLISGQDHLTNSCATLRGAAKKVDFLFVVLSWLNMKLQHTKSEESGCLGYCSTQCTCGCGTSHKKQEVYRHTLEFPGFDAMTW